MTAEKRICSKCGQPAMMLVERKMEIYNSVYVYRCASCQNEVELVPQGSIGAQFSLGMVFAVVIWGIFYFDRYNTVTDWVIFAVVVSVMPGMALFQLWKHRRYQAVESPESVASLEVSETAAITKKPVMWVEGLGILAGMLAPILFIAAFLGIAAIIGFINFTFFQ